MFNNIGQKIKVYAVIFFSVASCYVIIQGLALLSESPSEFTLVIFFALVLILFLFLFCYYLICGFGTLIEKTEENNEIQKKILAHLVNNNHTPANNSISYNHQDPNTAVNNSYSTPSYNHTAQNHINSFISYKAPNKDKIESVTLCGNCGYNSPYVGNCPKCGSSLKKTVYSDQPSYSDVVNTATETNNVPQNNTVPGKTLCPNCGYSQNSERTTCVNCGHPLI